MRFAVKSTVTLVALYLLIVGGLMVWMEQELQSVAGSLMEDTARLIGSEIAGTMSESAREQLLMADPSTRQRLVQIVADLSARSDVVASIAVVDETGKVVVSDELEIGQQLAVPAVIFQDAVRPQFLSSPSPFQGGTYHLFVPLVRHGDVLGYIRLSLNSYRIVRLYRRARRQVAIAALIGLGGIGALGVALHMQLSRRTKALARTLEATVRGETVPAHADGDEFAQVLEAAGKLGRELSETRERSSQAERRISTLVNFMDVGVLLLRPDRSLEFANAAAREVLGCADPGDLEQRWDGMKHILDEALAESVPGARADVDLPLNGRVRHLRLELHRPDDDERGGYLVLAKDRELLDAFETDLRLATQMRGLARAYGALAHELKAPLGAMALNLDLLNEALGEDAEDDPSIHDRRKRYTAVVRQELTRLNRSLVAVLSQTTSVSEARERFELRSLIRDLNALLAPQAKLQQVALDVHVPDTDVVLAGQRDRLKQAFLNVATNALEAMPIGGRMSVSVETRNGQATIAIRDSGPGIPPEVMGNIFRMYFTTKQGGTGIGLYVARSIVESHGGDIQVESEDDRGTCLTVTLPLAGVEA